MKISPMLWLILTSTEVQIQAKIKIKQGQLIPATKNWKTKEAKESAAISLF